MTENKQLTEVIEPGMKVHYTSPYCTKDNGVVKSVSEKYAFVVYHCNNDWDNYKDYTGACTNIEDLTIGWIDNQNKQS